MFFLCTTILKKDKKTKKNKDNMESIYLCVKFYTWYLGGTRAIVVLERSEINTRMF